MKQTVESSRLKMKLEIKSIPREINRQGTYYQYLKRDIEKKYANNHSHTH